MVTLIQGSWLVGYDGNQHRLITDGEVAYEDDKIIFVGKKYPGKPDNTINAKGMLVSPAG
jgi:cytosine/adenosine deaminase-related metal-dependent hydrolase